MPETITTDREGVTVQFFCDAIASLIAIHGNRVMSPDVDHFRRALAVAEAAFMALDKPKEKADA